MNPKNYFLPAIVTGFGAAVLTTVPGIKSLACCLIIPAAGLIAVLLYQKINKISVPIQMKEAVIIGLFCGLAAAVFSTFFDILITFITHSNDFVESLPQTKTLLQKYNLNSLFQQTFQLLQKMSDQIQENGFSFLYAGAILFSNLIVDSIFGIIGSIIGLAFVKRRINQ